MRGLTKAIAFLGGLAALSPSVTSPADADQGIIELLHLWRTPGEQAALHVFRDALWDRGVEWNDTPVLGGATGVRSQLSDLMAAEAPPSIVQWVPTQELHELFDIGVFQPVETVAPQFAENLLPEIREIVEVDGELRILPVGIHTFNFMSYNKALIQELGIEIPTTWEDYLSLGPLLQERGIPLLSVSDESWQLNTMYRTIMSARFSHEELTRLMTQDGDFEQYRPQIEEVFEILFALKKFAAPDRSDLRWENAVARVENGEALSVILGDYIVAEFQDMDNMICAQTPEANFVAWGFDSFVFTHTSDPDRRTGQLRFAEAASNIENVIRYAQKKGGLPVIKGVTPDQLSACSAETMQAWEEGPRYWDGLILGKTRALSMRILVHQLWTGTTEKTPQEAADEFIRMLELT